MQRRISWVLSVREGRILKLILTQLKEKETIMNKKMSANISILAILTFFLLCIAGGVSLALNVDSLHPYVQRAENGWIDWENGLIYGVGRASLSENGNSRPRAMGAAQVGASGNIVKIAAEINVDDQKKVKAIAGGRFVVKLKAFLRYREKESRFVTNTKEPYVEVVQYAPINGISGLSVQVLNELEQKSYQLLNQTTEHEASRSDEDATWLVLDARKLPYGKKLQPALFPKIVSKNGEVLYSKERVDSDALLKTGMVKYVTTNASMNQFLSEVEPEKLPFFSVFTPDSAYADDLDARRKKRGQYVVKDVQDASGLYKTNLVINEQDARGIKSDDKTGEILRNCRVIVVVSSPLGGIEGRLSEPLKEFAALNLQTDADS